MSKRRRSPSKVMESSHSKQLMESMFFALGRPNGDDFIIGDPALECLKEIYRQLICEDQTLRTYRRATGSEKYITNNLIPILIHAKDAKLIKMIIRLFGVLTIPIESLFSVEVMMRTKVGQSTLSDVNMLLVESKESFSDARATRAIVDHMRNILEEGTTLSTEYCAQINDCLFLLRNILHIPGRAINENDESFQVTLRDKIIWHLFMSNIDKILIYLMSCPQREQWSVIMVQLIAVLFKDQHSGNLLKLLNNCLQDALSDSTDDYESNTPTKDSSAESSPIVTSDQTSDQTSDSSDNGGAGKSENEDSKVPQCNPDAVNMVIEKNEITSADDGIQASSIGTSNDSEMSNLMKKTKKCPTNTKNVASTSTSTDTKTSDSDCGYGTHQDSFEDQSRTCKKVHQKPHRLTALMNTNKTLSPQEEKDIRRKKLVKRSKSSLINMKGLVHHTPTDEDISNVLKEFTVDFLLKAYSSLVQDLHNGFLCDNEMHSRLDISVFFWLIGYFLKLAAEIELDLDHVKCILSYETISFLTYETMNQYEHFELMIRFHEINLTSYIDRLHTAVASILVILQAVEKYARMTDLSEDDKNYVRLLRLQISVTDDLRHLFILLIRNYRPEIQSKSYLKDLIVTNHILLLMPENMNGYGLGKGGSKLKENVRPFATPEMMHQYGILLQNYLENGEYVNDCIFTMMFHVGCLGEITALFEPNIIKIYSKIWATDYELRDDWLDLINQVMNKFVKTSKQSLIRLSAQSVAAKMLIEKPNKNEFCYDVWSKEEISVLHWNYEQSKLFPDLVGQIVKQFNGKGIDKYRLSVIQHLLQQEIIDRNEYNRLMKYEHDEYERDHEYSDVGTIEIAVVKSHGIQVLKEKLLAENKGSELLWLQKILIECCFAKLCHIRNAFVVKNRNEVAIIEPIPYQCILKKRGVPVIPWNLEQSSVLLYQPFLLFLHRLGFELPVDADKLFVRIPEFWTPEILFKVAEKLGPIDQAALKFDIKEMRRSNSRAATRDQSINVECPKNSAADLALPTKVGIDSPTLKFPINDKTDRPAHLVHKLDAFLEINISTACKRHKNDLDRDVDDKSEPDHSCNLSTCAYFNENMELI